MDRLALECSPSSLVPCPLTFDVDASDPDGDPLTFSATGPCHADSFHPSGAAWYAQMKCLIPSPGDYATVVTVRDDRGGEVSTSVALKGLLNGVRVSMSLVRPREAGGYFQIIGSGADGSRILCHDIVRRYAVTGECHGSVTMDLCLNGGFDMGIGPSGRPGLCTVTVTVANEVGVEGTGTLTFDPLAPGS